jgi:hypothetical protein
MPRFSRLVFILLGSYWTMPTLYAQDAEDPEGQAVEQEQERATRRVERQRQIDSLSDEQRQALRERKRIHQGRGPGQRGQRPQRRRPPTSLPPVSEESENEEPA